MNTTAQNLREEAVAYRRIITLACRGDRRPESMGAHTVQRMIEYAAQADELEALAQQRAEVEQQQRRAKAANLRRALRMAS